MGTTHSTSSSKLYQSRKSRTTSTLALPQRLSWSSNSTFSFSKEAELVSSPVTLPFSMIPAPPMPTMPPPSAPSLPLKLPNPEPSSKRSSFLSISSPPLIAKKMPHNSKISEKLDLINQLDQEHYLFRKLLGGRNHVAKLETLNKSQGATCLDIGHGNGVWLLEMASSYPKMFFHGVDSTSLHPTSILPLNCQFHHHMLLEKKLPFKEEQFDYIHQRHYYLSIPGPRMEAHFRDLYRVLRFDGVLELMDPCFLHRNCGPAGAQINAWFEEFYLEQQVVLKSMSKVIGNVLAKSGFRQLELVSVRIPTGNWGGDIGEMSFEYFHKLIAGMKSKVVSRFGICAEEFDRVFFRWIQEAESVEAYWELNICLAKKSV